MRQEGVLRVPFADVRLLAELPKDVVVVKGLGPPDWHAPPAAWCSGGKNNDSLYLVCRGRGFPLMEPGQLYMIEDLRDYLAREPKELAHDLTKWDTRCRRCGMQRNEIESMPSSPFCPP